MSELWSAVVAQLTTVLAAEGWKPAEPPARLADLAVGFVRPFGDGMVVTSQAGWSASRKPPLRVQNLTVGVTYEPLRQMWPLLGGYFWLALDEEPIEIGDDPGMLTVTEPGQVASTVNHIVWLIAKRSPKMVAKFPTFESLLRSFVKEDDWPLAVAALLAAAHRFEEAQTALSRISWDNNSDPRDRRAAEQPRRWIHSGGDPALIPNER